MTRTLTHNRELLTIKAGDVFIWEGLEYVARFDATSGIAGPGHSYVVVPLWSSVAAIIEIINGEAK